MRIFSTLRYSIILLAVLCASCGTALPTVKPYKLDVQQGNVVTSKMLLQLRPGMTKSQVRFIMGTPLIQDSFHGNRWDYVYQMREKGKITDQRRVILDFDGEALKTVRGDVIPKGSESKTDEGASNSGTRIINPTGKPEEKGVIDKLKFWKKDEAALAKEADVAKAKAEAVETAKKAAEDAKENADRQSATPIDEPQSIMAVPLEALPMADVPATPAMPLVEPVEVTPVVEMPPAVEPVKAPEPVVEIKHEKKSELAPVAVPDKIEAAKIEHVKVEPAKIKPMAVKPKEVTVKDASKAEIAAKEPVQMPVAVKSYESTSSMKFDRNLKLDEESEPAAASEAVMPRAGNKSVPVPKDLPAESKPGLFSRMLEKIGF
jgi:outer membrane protein assembly factor BamE